LEEVFESKYTNKNIEDSLWDLQKRKEAATVSAAHAYAPQNLFRCLSESIRRLHCFFWKKKKIGPNTAKSQHSSY